MDRVGLLLSLAEAIAQSVWRDDEKHFERSVAVFVYSVLRLSLIKAIGLQLSECLLDVAHLKEAAFLGWITAILGEPDLQIVPAQNHGFARRVVP